MKLTKRKKYWYFVSVIECPVCGRGKTYRVRRYTKKPKDYMKRQDYTESYDYCDV